MTDFEKLFNANRDFIFKYLMKMKQNPASDFPAIQHLPKKWDKIGIDQNVTLNGKVMRSVFRKCLRNADSLVKTRLSAVSFKSLFCFVAENRHSFKHCV